MEKIERVDKVLAEKYKGYAYMYAEYPNKGFWSKNIGEVELKEALRKLPRYKPTEPTLLYLHFPFCQSICHYCSCYKIPSRNYDRAKKHLEFVNREIEMLGDFCSQEGIDTGIRQVHFGGGSPSDIKPEEFGELVRRINQVTNVRCLDEFTIEIDPRRVDRERMIYYQSMGVSRISFGVQEFNLEVQKAINRVQPPELLEELMTPNIRSRFQSVSFDILYGLPQQTRVSFAETMERVLEFSPDRVVLLSFNYSPDLNPNQRAIHESELPSLIEKEDMFFDSAQQMLDRGYVRVGLEHFVKPGDRLAKAWQTGNFNWNMGGYNLGRANKIIGVGPSSASRITDDFYFQDSPGLDEYEESVAQGRFPICKGYRLTQEDKIRRAITTGLRSKLALKFEDVEREYEIDFRKFFEKEMARLSEFEDNGIIELDKNGIRVTPRGMPFVSFVCMNFDAYHRK